MINTKIFYRLLLPLALCFIFTGFSCAPPSKPVKITTLDIPDSIFVQTTMEFTCIATSATGDRITYKWSCDKGSLSGEGQKVTWTSPNEYGNFHILVTAQDTKGNTDQASATIKVVYNPNPSICPSCRQN